MILCARCVIYRNCGQLIFTVQNIILDRGVFSEFDRLRVRLTFVRQETHMSDITERIARLSPEKLALLNKRNEKALASLRLKKTSHTSPTQSIPQRKDFSPTRLSITQEQDWARVHLELDETFSCVHALRVKGSLKVATLEQVLNEIIRRHEILRTTFTISNGSPVQVILPRLTLKLPLIVLNERSESDREARIQNLILEKMQQRFDLNQEPLIDVALYRLDHDEHALLLTRPHMLMDGWSSGTLLREVLILYDAYSSDSPSPLPEPTLQYADYACWQRQWLQSEEASKHLVYWKQKLKGATPIINLPYDRPRPDRGSLSPTAARALLLPLTLSEAIADMNRREGVTPFMTIMTTFLALLHRYTKQDDLCVSTYTAGRNRSELEPLLGTFVNTLVLRTNVSDDASFRELLRQVREVTIEAFAHEVPFSTVADVLQLNYQSGSPHPLTEVHCRYSSSAMAGVGARVRHETNRTKGINMAAGLAISRIEYDYTTPQLNDLTLYAQDNPDGIYLSFDYATEWFDASTIDRLLRDLQCFLEGVVQDPQRRIASLKLSI